jgi:nucleoside-diphosphate-sugar epimerase
MIVVTGGTGLVGGNLLWHLLQENDRIIAIKRLKSNLEPLRVIFSFYTNEPDTFLSRIEWKVADVLDENSLLDVFRNAKTVYHCAAVVSLGSGTDALLDTNIVGTKNVVDAAIKSGVEKLCFVSSIAACGKAAHGEMIDEESRWVDTENRSPYSRSKYLSEQEVWKGIARGLNAVIVNPGVILGVSGTETGSSQLFSQVRKGLMFYTNGGSGYVDVQDVVKVMTLLTNSHISSQRFVMVAENCSNRDVLNWMADGFRKHRPFIGIGKNLLWFVGMVSEVLEKLLHLKPLVDRNMARSATNREYYSSRKLQEAIGFQFTIIEKSIREICEFQTKYSNGTVSK